MAKKKREKARLLVLSGAFDLADDRAYNVPRFHARVESGAVVGEGWSEAENHIEADALIDYKYCLVPHLEFANLRLGDAAALSFLGSYGPLRRAHYFPTRRNKETGLLEESRRFRTPLNEFWKEQGRFRKLVLLWCELSAPGASDEQKAGELVEALEDALAEVRPNAEVSQGGNVVAGFGADLLTSLYFCLWLDIASGRPVRCCANEPCDRFFRPSRENQIYHDSVCARRKTQREYVRAKRARAKKKRARR